MFFGLNQEDTSCTKLAPERIIGKNNFRSVAGAGKCDARVLCASLRFTCVVQWVKIAQITRRLKVSLSKIQCQLKLNDMYGNLGLLTCCVFWESVNLLIHTTEDGCNFTNWSFSSWIWKWLSDIGRIKAKNSSPMSDTRSTLTDRYVQCFYRFVFCTILFFGDLGSWGMQIFRSAF